MPDIRIGTPISQEDHSECVWDQDTTNIINISNTSFTVGSPEVATTFVAPTSGRVVLIVGGGFRDAGGQTVQVTPYIFTGSSDAGTNVLGSAGFENHGAGGHKGSLSQFAYFSRRSLLEGLTPGNTYYAQLRYRVDGGSTADIGSREIIVKPSP